ncbi:hypothetical protein ACWEVP_31840 [Amycolatopsis sp. NPDC003865]
MTFTRFFEICYVLRVKPIDVVAAVEENAVTQPDEVRVNLRAVAKSTRAELRPAARWARVALSRRKGYPAAKDVITLTPAALSLLSELCGMSCSATAEALQNA